MTGSVIITAAEHDSVVEVPARLVLDSGGSNFVLVQKNGHSILQPVALGLAGDNGLAEVVSGLIAGDKISDF